MSEERPVRPLEPATPPESEERVHPLQRLMDNPWLLLVLSLVITGISYTAWGWIEMSMLEPAQLP